MSHASLFLGPRSAAGILTGRFGSLRDNVSGPQGSTPRRAGEQRHQRGGPGLASAARQDLRRKSRQVQEVRWAVCAGPPPRASEQGACGPQPICFYYLVFVSDVPSVFITFFFTQKHHYQDLPEYVKRHVGSMPEGYLSYFTRRYPRLFLHVYSVIANSLLRRESMFRTYFDLND
jgi:Ribonuclease 2-5A